MKPKVKTNETSVQTEGWEYPLAMQRYMLWPLVPLIWDQVIVIQNKADLPESVSNLHKLIKEPDWLDKKFATNGKMSKIQLLQKMHEDLQKA